MIPLKRCREMEKPKRLRTILYDNLKVIRDNVLAEGDFTYQDLDKLESEIQTFVKHTIHSVKELGLEVDSESFIGDLD